MLHRRTFISQTGALAAGTLLAEHGLAEHGLAEEAPLAPPLRVLDTHTHFYDISRPQGVPWPGTSDKLLYRTVMPDEFKKLTAPYNVKGTVVIEARWPVEDNQWALDTLAPDDFIPGIIGRLPLDEDFEKNAARFAEHKKFRGLRVRKDELKELAAFKWMQARGWTVDVLGGSDALADVLTLARRVPELTIVINHLPKDPLPDADAQKAVEAALDGLAKLPNVNIKVSNVLRIKRTDLNPCAADYRHLLDPIWERFGERRVIFGSNWPVSDKHNGPYGDLIQVMNQYTMPKGKESQDLYFWKNGVRAYGLEA